MFEDIPDEERDVVAIAQDVLRGYGHDAIADALVRRVSPVTREALIEAMKAVDSLTVGNKSCSRDGCNHWAGYQDSGSMDWCACHYGADTSECDGQPEPSLPTVERHADAIMSLFPVSPPAEVTDAMVEKACDAYEHTNAFGPERETRMRAALTAALGGGE